MRVEGRGSRVEGRSLGLRVQPPSRTDKADVLFLEAVLTVKTGEKGLRALRPSKPPHIGPWRGMRSSGVFVSMERGSHRLATTVRHSCIRRMQVLPEEESIANRRIDCQHNDRFSLWQHFFWQSDCQKKNRSFFWHHAGLFVGVFQKSILNRVCQLLAIRAHKMAPRTSRGLQERAWDTPT